MVECLVTLPRGRDRHLQVLANPVLPDVVVERARPQAGLELRDRLPAALPVTPDQSTPGGAVRADLLSALTNLGYPRPTVEKAVGDVLKAQPSATFDEALRQALGRLSRA